MSVYARIVHMHESKDYILRPLWDGRAEVPPVLSWWGRGVESFDDPCTVEGGPATTEGVAGLLDDRLHPSWARRLRGGATLEDCRLGRKPPVFSADVTRSAVAGISANIAPSKSVSMLMVAGDDTLAHIVTQAHLDAVRAALNFLQDHGAIARYGMDVLGLVGVLDQRYTSKVGNPHLSTTATIVNNAPRRDGKWVSPDTREILRWMFPVGTYVEAYMLRALSAYPELKTSVTIGDGLPSVTCGAVDEGMCQRFSSDSTTRRPLPAARGLASVVTSSRPSHADLTLRALRRHTELDTEPVMLGEREALPMGTEKYLGAAREHALARLTTRHAGRAILLTHHLVSSALAGLILAGAVNSPLDHDVRRLVQLLRDHPALREQIQVGARVEREGRASVTPGL